MERKLPRKYIRFNKKLEKIKLERRKEGHYIGKVYRDRHKDGTLSVNVWWARPQEIEQLKPFCDYFKVITNEYGRFEFYNIPPQNWAFDENMSFKDNMKAWRVAKRLGY